MKQIQILLLLIFGLSLTVQAKFFNFEKPGIKCTTEKTLAVKNINVQLPAPKYVFAEGEYHQITSNVYPFYKQHSFSSFMEFCYKPNTPAPLGSLWLKSLSESSYTTKSNANNGWSMLSLNPNLDLKPVYKLCSDCKISFKPNAAIHLKHKEKLVYYLNEMQ